MLPDASLTSNSLARLAPEFLLVLAAFAMLIVGRFFPVRSFWKYAALGAWLACGAALVVMRPANGAEGVLAIDALASLSRWGGWLWGLLLIIAMPRDSAGLHSPRTCGLLLLLIAGMMLVGQTADLALLALALELVTVPLGVLLFVLPGPYRHEVAFKHFALGGLATVLWLLGLSFLFGLAGSTRLPQIAATLTAGNLEFSAWQPLAAVALILIFAGLGFRLFAAPLHFHALDLFQGTTYFGAALLTVAGPWAALLALMRVMISMPGVEDTAWRLALIASLLSLVLGSTLALWQENLRRLCGAVAVAQAGLLLIGVAAAFALADDAAPPRILGWDAAWLQLVTSSLALVGICAGLTHLGSREEEVLDAQQLAGLLRTDPWSAAMLSICLLSLAGLPPLAGYWGKFFLLLSALQVDAGSEVAGARNWFLMLALAGMVCLLIVGSCLVRIVAVICFRTPRAALPRQGGTGAWLAMSLCGVLTLWLGLIPSLLWEPVSGAIPRRPAAAAASRAVPVEVPKTAGLGERQVLRENETRD